MAGYQDDISDYYSSNNPSQRSPQRQRTHDYNSPRVGLPPRSKQSTSRGVGFDPPRQPPQQLQRQVHPATYNAPYGGMPPPIDNSYDHYDYYTSQQSQQPPPQANDYYYNRTPLVNNQWNDHQVLDFNEKANKRKVSSKNYYYCCKDLVVTFIHVAAYQKNFFLLFLSF